MVKAKARTKRACKSQTVSKVYVLRTCREDMTSHRQFKWPESGPVVCSDWKSEPVCGFGLHGLLWGIGNYGLMSLRDPKAKWLVVEVNEADVVKIDNAEKVKFPKGNVVYCGSMAGALALIAEKRRLYLAGFAAQKATTGNMAPASTTGKAAPASTTGNAAPASTTGYAARASTTGYAAPASAMGERGIACCLGNAGRAKAGKSGSIILSFWDENAERMRHVVAYVGEGIKEGVWYKIKSGKIVRDPNQT